MLLLLFSIVLLHFAVNGQIASNVNDITCSQSQTECNVDCTDSSIHCHGIHIYSWSNSTTIHCKQDMSCTNLQIHCEKTDQCILNCDHGACWNATLICNPNHSYSICECQGSGCPSVPVLTNTLTRHTSDLAENNDQYTVDQSLVIMFFVAFFAVVLCCFCVLVVALCMGVLYFSEKKKQQNLKTKRKISSLSNSTSKDKYDKSEAILNMRRMTLSRSNKNRSYDTTVSAMVTDDIDEKEHQMLMMSPTTDDIITIKPHGGQTRESEEKLDIEQAIHADNNTHNSDYIQEEEEEEEEEQKEGDKPELQLKKFDSEDLYIVQAQSTLQYRVNYNELSPILMENNNDEEMGSNDHCIQHSDHDSGDDNMSAYTLDGHVTQHMAHQPPNIRIDSDTNHVQMEIVHNSRDDIGVDISAQLPASPDVHDGIESDTLTKHPPKASLLRPPTVGNDASPKYHGTQNSDAGSNTSDKSSIDSDYTFSAHNKEMIVANEDEKEGMNHRIKRMQHLQPLPETMHRKTSDNHNPSNSLITFATYNESEDYKDAIHPLHRLNPLQISRSSPPPQSRSISQSTDLQSESTFTIKSAAGTGNNSDLSRTSMSLNSAAAVCIAFPDTNKKVSYHHKMPFGISSVPNYVHSSTKHKNYYHGQMHSKRNLAIFDANHNKLNITPLNSPMEKPMIVCKAPSTTAMVPSLPSSPRTSIEEEEDDAYIPSPALMIPHPMSDDSVMRSRRRTVNHATSERKRTRSRTKSKRSASNDTTTQSYYPKASKKKRNGWKRHHESVPSYSNSHEQGMEHTITLMEPHRMPEIVDDEDCEDRQSEDEEPNATHSDHEEEEEEEDACDNKEENDGANVVGIGYRATSKSTGNIVSNNPRKIKIKRNSKPIIKVYRNKSKSNIVLPTNDFNKNVNEMAALKEPNVEWNTTIMMTPPPPPPPIAFGGDIKQSKRTRKQKFSASPPLAAIIPSPSSFITNIIK